MRSRRDPGRLAGTRPPLPRRFGRARVAVGEAAEALLYRPVQFLRARKPDRPELAQARHGALLEPQDERGGDETIITQDHDSPQSASAIEPLIIGAPERFVDPESPTVTIAVDHSRGGDQLRCPPGPIGLTCSIPRGMLGQLLARHL